MTDDTQDADGVDIGKKHKIGHLRVDTQGHATFKRLPTNELVDALQLGIQYSVGGLEARPTIDVLFRDFTTVEIINFPKEGRTVPRPTPPHRFNDFTIRSYAPDAFRHFRRKFHIKPEDYLSSICEPFRELKNPGASGSLFYLTSDDKFIIKTVQKKEAEFLKALLPGYYLNVTQNQDTLLPKFYGLYCYQVTEFLPRNKHGIGDNKNIRITVMNNLIPSNVHIHEKYDLKGSKYKRQANSEEKHKESPTWKDLDFIERHPNGFLLEPETFDRLKSIVERDCRVLESFHIMDYSFLIGVHKDDVQGEYLSVTGDRLKTQADRMMYTPSMVNIRRQISENKPDNDIAKIGGIPVITAKGEKLSIYVGIIDILQPYHLRKKLEHTLKSVVTDGTQISVTNPTFYSERFKGFLFSSVFKKGPPKIVKQTSTTESRISINATNKIPKVKSTPRVDSPQLDYTNSNSSADTTKSRIASYYGSLRSSQKSDSSTTLYASSRQSDSLYNQPRTIPSPTLITTSFRKDQKYAPKLNSYRDISNPSTNHVDKRQNKRSGGKVSASTTNLSQRSNISDYSSIQYHEDYPSSDEITRL